MDMHTRDIAIRLKWARTNSEISIERMAAIIGISPSEYRKYESGEQDFYFSHLYKAAEALGMDLSELVSGENSKLKYYDVTRRGGGMPIKNSDEFIYSHLAPMMKNRLAEPFMVTAVYDSEAQGKPITLSTHKGQELDYILKGTMKVQIGDHVEILYPGDSIFYDSSYPHGNVAIGGEDCEFLAIVMKEHGAEPDSIDEKYVLVEEGDAGKYDNLIYKKFVRETLDKNGLLSDIDIIPTNNFNFGYDVVDALAQKCPDKLCMLWLSADKEEKRFTYADMAKYSNMTANMLLSLGVKKGDRVMLVLKRDYRFWFSLVALHKIGAVALPATHQLVEKDFDYRFKAAGVSAIICTEKDGCPNEVDKAAAKCPDLALKIIAGAPRDGWICFDEAFEKQSDVLERIPNSKDDPSVMFFTSGTTGYPKIAAHSFTYPLGHIVTARWWHHVDPDGIHFTISDTGWGKALWGKIYGQWLCETPVFVYDFDRFSAGDILPLFAKYNITTFCAPPTMYRFFIKENLENYDLKSVKHTAIAGEALNPEVFNKFYEATGLKLMEGFGQTETTLTVGNMFGRIPKPGSMGLPNPAYNVVLVKPDGEPADTGEVGEVCIRTDCGTPCGMFIGYYNDPESTAAAWHDGLYHTGDMAWRDEDGYFWYVGRGDDLIKSSGYRIGPFEIESVIMELPYVLECGVTGEADEIRGQIVKATIVLTEGTEPSEELVKEIQNYVKKRTAPYKYPRKVVFVKSLPKTISGKIIRKDL